MRNSNFKKNQDVKLKDFEKNQKLENELGTDYFEHSANDISKNNPKTNNLAALSEKSLNNKYRKPNN